MTEDRYLILIGVLWIVMAFTLGLASVVDL